LLVHPANSGALEQALCRLADSSALRRRLGESAQKRFEDEFTETRTLQKTADWLRGVHEGL